MCNIRGLTKFNVFSIIITINLILGVLPKKLRKSNLVLKLVTSLLIRGITHLKYIYTFMHEL